jgi:hypothetical protein
MPAVQDELAPLAGERGVIQWPLAQPSQESHLASVQDISFIFFAIDGGVLRLAAGVLARRDGQ